jgi:hypothetical protein
MGYYLGFVLGILSLGILSAGNLHAGIMLVLVAAIVLAIQFYLDYTEGK